MQQIEIQEYANQLLETHGDKAIVVAARKACALKKGEIAKRLRRGGISKQLSS